MCDRLIATQPVLYLSKQYKAGDALPTNKADIVAAWLAAKSARWAADDEDAPKTTKAKAVRAAAEPGKEGLSDAGPVLQGKVPTRSPKKAKK